jgi:hypothetical protein
MMPGIVIPAKAGICLNQVKGLTEDPSCLLNQCPDLTVGVLALISGL